MSFRRPGRLNHIVRGSASIVARAVNRASQDGENCFRIFRLDHTAELISTITLTYTVNLASGLLMDSSTGGRPRCHHADSQDRTASTELRAPWTCSYSFLRGDDR